ncbi:hypothetical protein KKA14_09905, partial [bacterium]|nr:hypothetical protein [bacterium]
MKTGFSKKMVLLSSLMFLMQSCSFLVKEAELLSTETVLCDLVLRGFAKKMPSVDIYKKSLFGGCKKVENPDLIVGPSNIYSDSSCEQELPFNGETMLEFCKYEVVPSDISRNYIGNPNAWKNIEEG